MTNTSSPQLHAFLNSTRGSCVSSLVPICRIEDQFRRVLTSTRTANAGAVGGTVAVIGIPPTGQRLPRGDPSGEGDGIP